MTTMTHAPDPAPRGGLARKLPFLIILACAGAGAVLLRDRLTFDALASHRAALIAFRDAHYGAAVAVFLLAYVGIVALSLPGATVATLAGGFLFGLFPGVAFNVVAATLGAVAIFAAARAGFGAQVATRLERGGGAAARLMVALRENEWSVLFLMRLVPVVPFFLANLIPAFVGVRADRFAVSTFLGIVPGALVFTSVGSGLSKLFATGEKPDLTIIFSPPVLAPLLGLAALAMLPVVVKLLRGRR